MVSRAVPVSTFQSSVCACAALEMLLHTCVCLLTIKKNARNSLRVPALIIIVLCVFLGKMCLRVENQDVPSSSAKVN